jgi:hypothetical protein
MPRLPAEGTRCQASRRSRSPPRLPAPSRQRAVGIPVLRGAEDVKNHSDWIQCWPADERAHDQRSWPVTHRASRYSHRAAGQGLTMHSAELDSMRVISIGNSFVHLRTTYSISCRGKLLGQLLDREFHQGIESGARIYWSRYAQAKST